MACERCNDLCVTYIIRTPSELNKAIVVASENLKDGTIEEIPSTAPIFERHIPFAEIAAGSNTTDLLEYRFRCRGCGEVFSLTAETYHGSGGSWQPEREGISREKL